MTLHHAVVGGLNTACVLPVVEAAVILQRPARFPVVIDDQNMVMRLPANSVQVSDHQTVRVGVHLLRQLIAQVVHFLNIVGIVRAELFIAE